MLYFLFEIEKKEYNKQAKYDIDGKLKRFFLKMSVNDNLGFQHFTFKKECHLKGEILICDFIYEL